MSEKEPKNLVHQDAIHVETIRKEQRHQRLHTEFSINPRKKLHVLTDKPTSRKPTEVTEENSEFIKAFQKAREEPTKKYIMPQTSSQEVGWWSAETFPVDTSGRFHFRRFMTDVTKHKEAALRSSINY